MRRCLALSRYHFLSLWNWRTSYYGRFVEPLAFLAFLVAGLDGTIATADGMSYTRFAFLGMIGFMSFRSATAVLSDVSNDRKWGILAIFGLYGGSLISYVGSIVLFAVAVFGAQVLVVAGVAALLFDPLDLFDQYWTVGLVGLLLCLGWIGVGVAIGARVDSYARRDFLVTMSALPMVLSAPIFFPLDDANFFVRAVSFINPLSYQVSWVRDADGLISAEVALAMIWATAGLAVGYVLLRGADRLSVER